MPGPPAFGAAPITNIRNVKSPHWQRWLKPKNRCVVPWTSFCEYADTKPRKTPTWFALDDSRPLAVFAGLWARPEANPVEGEHQLFGFLACDANAEISAIHPKAMPVILTTELLAGAAGAAAAVWSQAVRWRHRGLASERRKRPPAGAAPAVRAP
jgi:putative SOS response-associated peptidase YedK